MRLLLDIGNSRIKWACYSQGMLGAQSAIAYRQQLLDKLFNEAWLILPRPEAVIMISVAEPCVEAAISGWVEKMWGVPLTKLATQPHCAGVSNGYLQPQQLGVDRWAAIVAAYQLTNGAVCIIDSGTAFTCDAVDESGNHLGGLIVPGASLQKELLLKNTSNIEIQHDEDTHLKWGQDTTTCIESGILLSQLALLERCVQELRAESEVPVSVVITGGDAERLLSQLPPEVYFEPDLVLRGVMYMMLEQMG